MIDMNKKYRTRNGRMVRIYCVDAGGNTPVHGATKDDKGLWRTHVWDEEGYFYPRTEGHPDDLIEIRPRIKMPLWINIYTDVVQTTHPTREEADLERAPECIACVHVEIDVDKGYGL